MTDRHGQVGLAQARRSDEDDAPAVLDEAWVKVTLEYLLAYFRTPYSSSKKSKLSAFNNALHWHFIPSSTLKLASCCGLVDATPLLEEEGNTGLEALVAQVSNPFFGHRPGPGP